MKNTSILLIVVLLVIVLVGGIFYLFYNRETEEVINANVTITNVTLDADLPEPTLTADNWAPAESGDIAVNATGSHKDTTFTFTSAMRTDDFRGRTPDAGKTFVVVYFRDIPLANQEDVVSWATNEAKITDGTGTAYDVEQLKLITEFSETTDTGFFQFSVPTNADGFSIQFGTGDNISTTALGF